MKYTINVVFYVIDGYVAIFYNVVNNVTEVVGARRGFDIRGLQIRLWIGAGRVPTPVIDDLSHLETFINVLLRSVDAFTVRCVVNRAVVLNYRILNSFGLLVEPTATQFAVFSCRFKSGTLCHAFSGIWIGDTGA